MVQEQVLARSMELELARSKGLEQVLRNHNQQQRRIRNSNDLHNEHAAWQASQRVKHKDQHRLVQHRNRNRLLELARSKGLEQVQVLARSTELLQSLRNHNRQQLRIRNLNGLHNEHAAWQAGQRVMHKDQHMLVQHRNRNQLLELARSKEQVQVLARSKELLQSLRNHNRQQLRIRNSSGLHNEHAAWQASQRVMHKDQHRQEQHRNRNRLRELAHSMELVLARSKVLLVPGKSVHNRREFRDGYDYPSGSSGRSPNRIRSHQRRRRIRNLLQQVLLHNRNPVGSLTPDFRNIPGPELDLTGRFQNLRRRIE